MQVHGFSISHLSYILFFILSIKIFIEKPSYRGFVGLIHGVGFVRVNLVIVTFEEVEKAGYQEELIPPAVLFAEQMAKQGVPLAERKSICILDSLNGATANMGCT
jgi:hypothetical protein